MAVTVNPFPFSQHDRIALSSNVKFERKKNNNNKQTLECWAPVQMNLKFKINLEFFLPFLFTIVHSILPLIMPSSCVRRVDSVKDVWRRRKKYGQNEIISPAQTHTNIHLYASYIYDSSVFQRRSLCVECDCRNPIKLLSINSLTFFYFWWNLNLSITNATRRLLSFATSISVPYVYNNLSIFYTIKFCEITKCLAQIECPHVQRTYCCIKRISLPISMYNFHSIAIDFFLYIHTTQTAVYINSLSHFIVVRTHIVKHIFYAVVYRDESRNLQTNESMRARERMNELLENWFA